MAQLPFLKLGGLLVKTIAKPVASRMKIEAKKHESMKAACVYIGQISHQITSRLNVLASGYKILGIKPLPEDEALSRGVNFLSESFVFLVGGGIIVYEYNKSEAKSAIKNEQQARKEAEFLQRLADAEAKLAILEAEKGDFDDKTFDLDLRLKNVEKAAEYWAMQQVNDVKHEASLHQHHSNESGNPSADNHNESVMDDSYVPSTPSTALIIPQDPPDIKDNNWLGWLDISKWIWGNPPPKPVL